MLPWVPKIFFGVDSAFMSPYPSGLSNFEVSHYTSGVSDLNNQIVLSE